MLLSRVLDPSMDSRKLITVRVVYALADQQYQVDTRLDEGATVEDAVRSSGLALRFAEIGTAPKCAVFGRAVETTYPLRDGDRIEILRSLVVDPKDNRRK